MGRPLTNKWTGIRSDSSNPVLTPYCNLYGVLCNCYILRQIGNNKFLVCDTNDFSISGTIQLTNGVVSNSGDGYIGWRSINSTGYVARISDNNLRLFSGGNVEWSIYGTNQNDSIVYVYSNSDDQNG